MGLPVAHLVVATNENDVLDEFFRTGTYRVRGSAETHETSSPSMDISKASNFERFIYDLVGRDGARTKALFGDALSQSGAFTVSAEEFVAIGGYGFQSGSSNHADRLDTIRSAWERFATLIDTHTADGLKVAAELVQAGTPMIVLETALPAKFAQTIREAVGQEPPRPAKLDGIEALPKRFTVMPPQTALVKAFIEQHCAG
jgi:threonine synthase